MILSYFDMVKSIYFRQLCDLLWQNLQVSPLTFTWNQHYSQFIVSDNHQEQYFSLCQVHAICKKMVKTEPHKVHTICCNRCNEPQPSNFDGILYTCSIPRGNWCHNCTIITTYPLYFTYFLFFSCFLFPLSFYLPFLLQTQTKHTGFLLS